MKFEYLSKYTDTAQIIKAKYHFLYLRQPAPSISLSIISIRMLYIS